MDRDATPDRYAWDMHTIPFTRSAAWVTIGEGLSLGARYWAATWERWVLAVVAVALTDGLATWLLGSTLLDQATMTQLMLPGANAIDPSALPRLLAGPLAVGVVSLVAGWFLYANAVAGLRGREVTLGWVLGAGLRTLLMLAGVAFVLTGIFAVLALLGPLGLLAMAGALPMLVYLAFRLQFWVVGVFDGSGRDGGRAVQPGDHAEGRAAGGRVVAGAGRPVAADRGRSRRRRRSCSRPCRSSRPWSARCCPPRSRRSR